MGIGLLLTAFVSASASHAANDFARCSQAHSQIQSTQDIRGGDDARIKILKELEEDLTQLMPEMQKSPETYPRAFLTHCFEQKKQALQNVLSSSSESTRHRTDYKLSLARLAELQGDFENAYKYYLEVANTDQSDEASRWNAYRDWARFTEQRLAKLDPTLFSKKDLDEILRQSDKILLPLIQSPTASKDFKLRALETRAQFWSATLHNEARALPDWEMIVGLDPRSTATWVKIAAYYDAKGDRKKARQAYERILMLEPHHEEVLKRSRELAQESGDLRAAEKFARASLAHHPGDVESLVFLAALLKSQGRLREAEKFTQAALQSDPEHRKAKQTQSLLFELKGDAQLRKKRSSAALAQFQEALKLTPDRPALRIKMAKLIFAYEEKRQFPKGEACAKDLREVLRLLPKGSREQAVLKMQIRAAQWLKESAVAQAACDSWQKNFEVVLDLPVLLACADTYTQNGQMAKQKALLQSAMMRKEMKGHVRKIAEALNAPH